MTAETDRFGADYYDRRFKAGYMQDWPPEKVRRVQRFVEGLGLPSSGTALDFGCGAGLFTSALVAALPGWKVTGVDITPSALDAARRREPRAEYQLLDRGLTPAAFDLIFTHHVLEHVPDIAATAGDLAAAAKPAATMVHILPCGNAGSLEHRVCTWRRDGFIPDADGSFFFEEEGHLRRLTTDQLVGLWAAYGFRSRLVAFSNHRYGAIHWLTDQNLSDVLRFADPSAGIDRAASRRLWFLRARLATVWAMRRPLKILKYKRAAGISGARDVVVAGAALVLFPVGWLADRISSGLANREWRKGQDRPGSEMYVVLERSSATRG